jgi:serine/threonine protein kinase/WD40 repeat protein
MNDPADSYVMDENLARLLAAYDQNIDGADEKAPTIGVPTAELKQVERAAAELPGAQSTVALDDFFHDPTQIPIVQSPRSGRFRLAGGPHRVGRFELRRQLGKGGCGIVFLAYDPKLEREVALKVPRPEMLLSQDARRRLVREALAAAEFDHPNLVPVYESGEIGPICYIATAFCPGQTLSEWLDRQAFPVPVRQAARLTATVAEAVQHAHDRGVLHRDLKPNNVILQSTKEDPIEQEPPAGSVNLRGEQFVPRIVDFGLAKLLERGGPSETTTRQILGTPKYMAPEQAQARHDDIGPAADVYALGVILYELITGRAPYEGETDVEVLRQSIDGKLVQPRHLRKDVPRDLEAICLKAMHRVPGRRYRTAIDLSDDLRRFLDDKPTLARPLKWAGRAARWLRRNDQTVALVTVTTIATILLAVGSMSLVQTKKLQDARARDIHQLEQRTRGDQHREYARALRSAFLAWRSGDRKAAEEHLDTAWRVAQLGGQGTDFAFAYLSRLVAADRLMIVCPAGAVTALAVSADGARLASGHADGTVALWDRGTGDPLGSVPAHGGPVTHLAFALKDARLLTVGAAKGDDTGLCWDVDPAGGLRPTAAPRRSLGRHVTCLAVAADGTAAVAGTGRGRVLRLDVADAARDRAVQLDQADPVTAVALCETGGAVLVGTTGGKVRRLTADLTPEDGEGAATGRVAALFDLGGRQYAAAGRTSVLMAVADPWAVRTRGPSEWLAAVPQGFAAGDGAGWVLLRSGRWAELQTGDTGDTRAGAATRDRKTLFTAGDDGIIRSWELPADLRDRTAATVAPVAAVAAHPDGAWFNALDADSLMLQFGTKDELAVPGKFAALRVLRDGGPDGTTLAVELRDRAAVLREPNAARVRARFAPPDGAAATAVDLSPDGATIAVGDDRGRVSVWVVATGESLGTVDCGGPHPVRRVGVTGEGPAVVAAAAGGHVGAWAVGDPKPLVRLPAETGTVFALFPGGGRLAVAGRSGVVRVWNLIDGREELTLHGHVGAVTGLGVAPDGRTLVSGGATGEVKMWEVRTGLELLGLRRHSGPVSVVEFSANGRLLVTAGAQLAVWDSAKE